MAARRMSLPADVQKVFDKYTASGPVRRLSKTNALTMLQEEFKLSHKPAEHLFKHFDADKNDVLSLWEFQHFYNVVGYKAPEIVERFQSWDKDKKGYLSREDVEEGLKTYKTETGTPLSDKDRALMMKTSMGESGTKMDLGKFVDLLARVRMYKPQNGGAN